MTTAKRTLSIIVCAAFVVLISFVLAAHGEPVNGVLWRDVLWRL
jgi:hypothetical protein